MHGVFWQTITPPLKISITKLTHSVASLAIKKLKTLRHPSVVLFIDSHESEKAVLLATESVEPLLMHLNQVSFV